MIRSLILCAAAFLLPLSACSRNDGAAEPVAAQPSDEEAKMTVISGEMTYRQRIALPANAVAVAELRAGEAETGTLVAEQRIELGGKQVPVPFSIEADSAKIIAGEDYYVRAAIAVDGAYSWVSPPAPVDLSDGDAAIGTLLLAQNTALAFASSYACGDKQVSIGIKGDVMTLQIDGESFALHPVVTSSGSKYEATGDASTYFWTKGDSALLSLHGVAYPECVIRGENDGAAQDEKGAGRAYKARGNEPGWSLSITDTMIVLLADYGERRIAAPKPAPEEGDGFTRYAVPAEELIVTIEHKPCADDATGMPYPDRVSVALGDRAFNGCGGEPASLLTGGEWVVEDIDNGGVIDSSRATLNFGEDGRVSGRGSCNTYSAPYTLTGEGLSFGNAAATLKACAPALMMQEQRFFDALSSVVRFEIDETGALILFAPDGRRLLARREG